MSEHRTSDKKVTTSEQMVLSSNLVALLRRAAGVWTMADAAADEIERLVSRNAQLEAESLKRDTELRMELDTNTEHCKARAALQHDLERHIAIASEHATENAGLSLSLEGAEIAANAFAQELNEMAAERERLRAALERIVHEMVTDAWPSRGCLARDIAREALAGGYNPTKSSPVGG